MVQGVGICLLQPSNVFICGEAISEAFFRIVLGHILL
jgi:hypothetical protein